MTAPAEAFAGFGEGAVEFYDGLLADNSKAYWTDHRAIYEQDVLEPMRALLATLAPEFGPGKIFRPYRDVRFSRDKTPYKTACGASVGPFYVQVSSDGLLVAGGATGGRRTRSRGSAPRSTTSGAAKTSPPA